MSSLASEQDLLRLVLDNMSDGVVVCDNDGKFILFNKKGEEIVGLGQTDYPPEEWAEKYRVYLPDGSRCPTELLPLVQAMNGAEIDDMELLIKHPILKRDVLLRCSGRPVLDDSGSQVAAVLLLRDITEQRASEKAQTQLVNDLRAALAEVRTLSGLLPICSGCKKIRDDKGYWNQIEAFLDARTEASFSHGICPDCAEKLYPEFDIYDEHS